MHCFLAIDAGQLSYDCEHTLPLRAMHAEVLTFELIELVHSPCGSAGWAITVSDLITFSFQRVARLKYQEVLSSVELLLQYS